MKKPGQRGSPKPFLQKGEMTSAQEMRRGENGQKLTQKWVHGLFLGRGGERKKPPCIKVKHPEWQKGKQGNTPNAPFFILCSFTLSPIKAFCGGEEHPSPRRVCFFTRQASPVW